MAAVRDLRGAPSLNADLQPDDLCSNSTKVIEATEPDAGHHVVDMACGYGEVLFRMAAQRDINGTGVDLSPWMIASAAAQTPVRAPNGTLQWVLGEARDFFPAAPRLT